MKKQILRPLQPLVIWVICTTLLLMCNISTFAQYPINTIAGNGTAGFSGDGGAATAAILNNPYSVVGDASGNIYFADAGNNRVRKINSSGIISTIAGTGTASYAGDGGQATAAQLQYPTDIALDGTGNIFICDNQNNRIRKINTSGVITTVAGDGTAGFSGDGSAATAAKLNHPNGLAVDGSGNIYIADYDNSRIRLVNSSGIISTVAGTGYFGNIGDDGRAATAATLNRPYSVRVDGSGNFYIVDGNSHRIRKVNISSGIISSFAGIGSAGFSGDGGPATASSLNYPMNLSIDGSGNVYIADWNNACIRMVNTSGIITSVAGSSSSGFSGDGSSATAARLRFPTGVFATAPNNIIIVDNFNERIRKISNCPLRVLGSLPAESSVCLAATLTLTDTSAGGTWRSSASSVASVNSSGVVRGNAVGSATITYSATNSCGTSFVTTAITTSNAAPTLGAIWGVSTVNVSRSVSLYDTSSGGTWTSSNSSIASIDGSGVATAVSAGNVTISYSKTNACGSSLITKGLTVNSGAICQGIINVAGNGLSGYTGDGGPATAARLSSPADLAVDISGNTYFPDQYYRIRKISSSGVISTFAGNGSYDTTTLGGQATASAIGYPGDIVCDPAGNVYFASRQSCILKVNASGVLSLFAGRLNVQSFAGDGGPATAAYFNYPRSIVMDRVGNMYVSDMNNFRVRKVSTSGLISTIAGNGFRGFSGDGGPASAAMLNSVVDVTIDIAGNLYLADTGNARIRKISTAGIITTVAGNGTAGYSGDGGSATAAQLSGVTSICVDSTGNLYISEKNTSRIRKVTPSGIISTIAGTGTNGYSSGGGVATASVMNTPLGLCVDANGNVLFSDNANERVRKIYTAAPVNAGAISGTGTVCRLSTRTFTTTGTGGVWSSSNSAVASVNSAGVVRGNTVGTAIISYTVTNGCYSALDTQAITVNPLPAVGTFSGPGRVCIGSSVTFTNSVAGGIWSSVYPANATISSGGVATGLRTPQTFIQYKVTNSCGSDSSNVALYVDSTAYTGTISGASGVCGAGRAALSVSGLTNGGTWRSSNTSIATVGYDVVHSTFAYWGVSVGSATLTYTVSTACNTDTAFLSVHVDGGSVAAIGPGSGTVSLCPATTTTLTDATAGGTWRSSNTSVATVDSSSGTVTGVGAGTAIISYVVTNLCGSNFSTRAVNVNPSPDAGTISGTTTICQDNNAVFTSSGMGSGTWSSSATSVATIGATNGWLFALSAGTATISYSVTNSCGTSLATNAVTVNPAARSGTISGASTVCEGATTTYTDTASGGTWSSTDTSIATVSTGGIVSGVSAGYVIIQYTVVNSCGTSTSSHALTVNPLPYVGTIGGATSFYILANATLFSSGEAGTWSSSSPGIASITTGGVVSGVSAGTAIISYSVTNGCGTRFDTSLMTVHASAGSCNIITAVAGSGAPGNSGDGTAATAARLSYPQGVTLDSAGNLYIADIGNHRVLRVMPSGVIATVAGNGTGGSAGDGGAATAAQLQDPVGLAFDGAGNLYIADFSGSRVRKVNRSGIISTFAGNGFQSFSGDGGQATAAALNLPSNVATDASGNVYITDIANYRIRKVSASGIITTLAGTGINGYSGDGGAASSARISSDNGICVDPAGNVYISDGGNHRIRKVNVSGIISTFAGTGSAGYSGDGGAATAAQLNSPGHMVMDNGGNIYFTDEYNNVVRKINPAGTVSTVGGTGTAGNGGDGGPATSALLNYPWGIAVDATGNNIYFSDYLNNRIRKIASGVQVPGAISGLSNVCERATITLSNAVTGGTWSSSNPAIATVGSTGVVTGISSGAATMSYTLSNSCGTATVTRNVVVNPLANPGTITGARFVCIGSSVTLTDTAAGGVWSSSATGTASVSAPGVVTGLVAGNATISYTVSNSCGAVSDTQRITIAPAANAGAISGAASVCTGATVTFTTTGAGGAWSSSNLLLASVSSTGIVRGLSPGLDTILYTVANACGTATATRVINVISIPSAPPMISGPSTIPAIGSMVGLTDSIAGGSWRTSNAAVMTVSASGMVTAVATGSATITYTLSNSCGSSYTTKTMTCSAVNHAPLFVNGSVMTIVVCGNSVRFALNDALKIRDRDTGQTLNIAAVGGPYNGTANVAYTAVSTGGIITPAGLYYTPATGFTGRDSMTLSVTDGLVSTLVTLKFVINPVPAVPVISGPAAICAGGTITLTATPAGGTWGSMDGNTTTGATTGIVRAIAGGGTSNIYYNSPNNTFGCRTQARTTVTLLDIPSAGSISGTVAICPGASATLSASVPGGSWTSSNTTIATVTSGGSVTGINSGSVVISYTVANACFSSTVSRSVTVRGATNLSPIDGAPYLFLVIPLYLTNPLPGGTWSSSNTSIAVVSATGVATGVAAGIDTVFYSYTNSCGITSSVSKRISVLTHRYENNNQATPEQEVSLIVYPNPATTTVTVEINNTNGPNSFTMFDATGRVVASAASADSRFELDMSTFAKGIYMLKVKSSGTVFERKIVLQ